MEDQKRNEMKGMTSERMEQFGQNIEEHLREKQC